MVGFKALQKDREREKGERDKGREGGRESNIFTETYLCKHFFYITLLQELKACRQRNFGVLTKPLVSSVEASMYTHTHTLF